MLCQMCLETNATVHILDRRSGRRFAEADYCQTCYDLKYVNPPARQPAFPRPRFTIKALMILAGLFALPNAAVALVMRSGLITGTPDQIRDWTLQAFLFANSSCGIWAAYLLTLDWLQEAQWHRLTGGLVLMPQPKELRPGDHRRLLMVLGSFLAWVVASMLLAEWLTPILWSGRTPGPLLLGLIAGAPLILWIGLQRKSHRSMVDRIRAAWRGASRRERFLRILGLSWSFVIVILMFSGIWLRWSSNPIISLGILAAIALGGQLLFIAGAVAATRRR